MPLPHSVFGREDRQNYLFPVPRTSITRRYAGRQPTRGELMVLREELEEEFKSIPALELLFILYETVICLEVITCRWKSSFISSILHDHFNGLLAAGYSREELEIAVYSEPPQLLYHQHYP